MVALQAFNNFPVNIFTDSIYIVKSIPLLEAVGQIKGRSQASVLLQKLASLIRSRNFPFLFGHL